MIVLFFIWALAFMAATAGFRRLVFADENTALAWPMAMLTSFVYLTMVSVVLNKAGFFHVGMVAGFLALPGCLSLVRRQSPRTSIQPDYSFPAVLQPLVYACLAALVLLYALYPTYYLFSDRDYGFYLIHAAMIAKKGWLDLSVPHYAAFASRFGAIGVAGGHPGLYYASAFGLSTDMSKMIPQFLQLFGAIGANFFAFFGVEGAVRTNAFIAYFGLLGFMLCAVELMGFAAALVATVALGLNAAMIFNARITLSEIYAFYSAFAASFFMMRCLKPALNARTQLVYCVVAALILGSAQFNRLDGILNIVLIFGFILADSQHRRVALKAKLTLLGLFLILQHLGLLDALLSSPVYTKDNWDDGNIKKMLAFNYSAVLAALFILASEKKLQSFFTKVVPLVFQGAAGLLLLWMLYGFFIRYYHTGDIVSDRAVRELGWFVTPALLFLTPVGCFLAARSRRPEWLPLLCLVGFTTFVYTWRPTISPDHYWATRRWIPFTIPGAILFGGYAIAWMFQYAKTKNRTLAVILASLACAAIITKSTLIAKSFYFTPLLRGLHYGYTDFIKTMATLPPKPAITKDRFIDGILTYIYDYPVVAITLEPGFETANINKGLGDYRYIGFNPVYEKRNAEQISFTCGVFPPRTIGALPPPPEEICKDLSTGFLAPENPSAWSFEIPPNFRGTHLNPVTTKPNAKNSLYVDANGTPGELVSIDRILIQPGHYEAVWSGIADALINTEDFLYNKTYLDSEMLDKPSHLHFATQPTANGTFPFELKQEFDVSEAANIRFNLWLQTETPTKLMLNSFQFRFTALDHSHP